MQGSVWTIAGQCLALESIFELGVLFLSRVAGAGAGGKIEIEINIVAKSENGYLGSYTERSKCEI